MLAKAEQEKQQFRSAAFECEAAIKNLIDSGDLLAVDFPLKHHFAPGLYAREIFIPAGSVIVGKIHKHGHLNCISRGRVRVQTEFGFDILDATESPIVFISEPHTKRVVYAETDTIWTTYHPTIVCDVVTDLEKIEQEVIAKSYEEFEKLSYSDVKRLIQ